MAEDTPEWKKEIEENDDVDVEELMEEEDLDEEEIKERYGK